MHNLWFLDTIILSGCADTTYWVTCDAQGHFVEETYEARSVVPDI